MKEATEGRGQQRCNEEEEAPQVPAANEGNAGMELWKEGDMIHPTPKCILRVDWVKLPWKPCPETRQCKGGITVVGSMKGGGKEDTI